MKKFKILFAVITVVAMLFTVASASVLKFGAETVEYTEGDLTISVYAAEDINYSAGGTFELVFDNTVWAFKGAAFDSAVTADGFVSGEDGTGMPNAISACISTGTAKTIAANQKIVDLTFEKIAGDAIGTKFELDFNVFGGNFFDGNGSPMDFSGAITVKAATPAGPVEEEVTGAVVECAKTWTAPKSAESSNTNTYTNVAVANGTCVAGAKEAGFKFIKNDENAEPSFSVTVLDAEATSGEGTIDYTAVMYGVKYDADRIDAIYAIPYYVIVK